MISPQTFNTVDHHHSMCSCIAPFTDLQVYLLDFGIARRYLNENNELKTPRAAVPFKGTVRFASLSCHRNKEMGPKDDCESWLYLLLDMLVPTGLPWKRFHDRPDVLRCKEELRTDRERRNNSLFNGIPCKDYLNKTMDYLDGLKYADKVDYQFLYDCQKMVSRQ